MIQRLLKRHHGICSHAIALSMLSLAAVGPNECSSSHGGLTQIPAEPKAVKVVTKREGDSTRFYVQNDELCEITMTFEMGLSNLEGSIEFPCTMTFPGKQTTEAFTLSAIDSEAKWEYTYTNSYKLGSASAQHDDSVLYQLPYAPGSAFRVTQAYGGSFSHKGSNKYAIDWKMPEGTPVYAARGGLVIKVKDDSKKGGASIKYDRYNNYVLIRHDDGTLGHYCHLKKDGNAVQAGDVVKAGDLIAHSGNTGFSSGPHLHFCVFKTKDGRQRESIPVRFSTADSRALTLVEGKTYTAAAPRATIARTVLSERPPQGAGLQ